MWRVLQFHDRGIEPSITTSYIDRSLPESSFETKFSAVKDGVGSISAMEEGSGEAVDYCMTVLADCQSLYQGHTLTLEEAEAIEELATNVLEKLPCFTRVPKEFLERLNPFVPDLRKLQQKSIEEKEAMAETKAIEEIYKRCLESCLVGQDTTRKLKSTIQRLKRVATDCEFLAGQAKDQGKEALWDHLHDLMVEVSCRYYHLEDYVLPDLIRRIEEDRVAPSI